MKTQIILTLIFSTSLFFTACDDVTNIKASGDVTTQNHSFSAYNQIDIESAFTAFIRFSDTEESIEIEANDNLHEYIEVREQSGTLTIGFRDNTNITGNATLNAYIVTKNIDGFSASGASRFIVQDEINEEGVSIFLSGASQFGGVIQTISLNADISGASQIQISGSSEDTNLTATGASQIEDFNFSTDYLNVFLSGASQASLTVNEELDVVASGASIVRYKGSGVVNSQNLSGESKIIKED